MQPGAATSVNEQINERGQIPGKFLYKGDHSLTGRNDFTGDYPCGKSGGKGMRKGKEAKTCEQESQDQLVLCTISETDRLEGVGGTRLALLGTVKYALLDITGKIRISSSNQVFLGRLDILCILYHHTEKEGNKMKQKLRNEKEQK